MAIREKIKEKILLFSLCGEQKVSSMIDIEDLRQKLRTKANVINATKPSEALELVAVEQPQLLIMFVDPEDDTGVEFLRNLRKKEEEMKAIVKIEPCKVFVAYIKDGKIPPEYEELGVINHFSPPLSPLQIERAVSDFITRLREEETKKTVMVVNEKEEELNVLSMILKKTGHKVVSLSNPKDAIKEVKSRRVDAAIIDLDMTEDDAAEVIRSLHKINDTLPVVVTTSEESAKRIVEIQDLNISTDLGIYAYFVKPIDLENLKNTVDNIIVSEKGATRYIVKPLKPREEKAKVEEEIKIMIVEDSAAMRKIIAKYLNELGYKNIVEAADGLEAIEKVDPSFSLLIVDWIMPEMDGLQFIKLLKRKPHLQQIPILMVTSQGEREKVIEALESGVDDYIVKPFTADTLKKKVEKILSKRRE